MADLKISQLTGATTPLTGVEVLPVVQSSTTKKVSVANLTAGRDVNATSFQVGTRLKMSSTFIADAPSPTGNDTGLAFSTRLYPCDGSGTLTNNTLALGSATYQFSTIYTGDNVIVGTAGKGVDFSANTPAAGKTSTLLNWYEEGTWTPTVTSTGGTITTSTSANCKYTRMGRTVVLTGTIGITTNGTGTGGINIAGLPFAAANINAGGGIARENSVNGKTSSITQTGSTTTFVMYAYDNTYPGADGANFNFQITYIV